MGKRNLYLSNTPVAEAMEKYRSALGTLSVESESIPVTQALGRVTSKAVFARFNSPLYDSAAMDGIAVISAHTVKARDTSPVKLAPRRDFIIADTGDFVSPPYDAVIMAEDIEPQPDGEVLIRAAASPWQHLRPVGEDVVRGEMLLPTAHRIRPMDIGVLLSGGVTEVGVRRLPRVAVIPTGTELIEPDAQPKEGDIVESNSHMLGALITEDDALPLLRSSVDDRYEDIKNAVKNAVSESDLVIINAGSSAGTEDYTVHILRELGEVIVHGVAMKPGKPVILAIVAGKPVIGIPGYPVSAYLAYTSFARPVLAALTGRQTESGENVDAVLTRSVVSSLKYREYVRVRLGLVGGRLVAAPLARGAGAAMSLVRADGFCVIDRDSEGAEAGEMVNVQLTRSLRELEHTLVSIGSHDLILDIIADIMPEQYPGFHLSGTHVGSMGGLLALKRGETHIAPTHLLDESTGTYNIPILKSMLSERHMALIRGVGRTQGIMVPKGNPLGIRGVSDLAGVRYINRQRGAGTRVLLDYLLKCEGVAFADINGYEREAATHMAVAAAVSSGSADAGMGVLSAARAMELDFIPVGDEKYDFAIPVEYLELTMVKAFIEILKSPGFHEKLMQLGGYTYEGSGEIIIIEQ